MDVVNLLPALERLEDNIDDLEEALGTLLKSSLEETSRKLPLLDRAKLHVLLTYALESLLHSYLRLHGVDAKEHPVATEINRVRQYFDKIKALETKPEKPSLSLDQQAARRFIAHDLAGNDKYDFARAEKLAKEKARAQLKAALLAKKQLDTETSTPVVSQESNDTPHTTSSPESDSNSDSESEEEVEEIQTEDPGKEFKDSTEYIEIPAEVPEGRKTAKMKAKERKEEFKSKKAERRAKREDNVAKREKQRSIRKERRLKKKAKKREKRAKEKEKEKAKTGKTE